VFAGFIGVLISASARRRAMILTGAASACFAVHRKILCRDFNRHRPHQPRLLIIFASHATLLDAAQTPFAVLAVISQTLQ